MDAACDLCGLSAGRHAISRGFDEEDRRFCCLGCMNVYTILRESGVLARGVDVRDTALFRESLRLGLISNVEPAGQTPVSTAETREALYQVSGMWCSSCAWVIERALAAESGVVSAEVMFVADLLRVKYCPQFVPPGRIAERVAALGYRLEEQRARNERDRSERRDLLLRIGVAAFLWMNVMTLSLVIYASYWEAISDTARRVVPLVLLALATPAVFYSAWPILRLAAFGLRARTFRMEALLALGILAAYGYSAAQALAMGRHYYFDTACAIVTLVLLGKLLEQGAKERTAHAIALLYRMMPRKARVIEDGREHLVSIEALEAGMQFLVKAGERIPADGVVVEGASHVDESVLTGESSPVEKRVGDAVAAGSLNTGAPFTARADRVGPGSTLHRMIRSVESATGSRSEVERVVDHVARVFVPVVMTVSVLTLLGSIAAGLGGTAALLRAISVLVIACPCALGIATPLAITAAVGLASRRGILVRDSRVLEAIGKINVVVLDKTGTVTTGEFGVLQKWGQTHFAAAVEVYSEHPVGRAIVRDAAKKIPPAREILVRKGMGIAGIVEGVQVSVGNRRMMAETGARMNPELEAAAAGCEAQGLTVVWIACDGEVTGAIALGDRLRPDALRLTQELRRRGVRTALISGDSETVTASVAKEIGVDEYRSGVLPEGKLALIRAYRQRGAKVAMVGDGINDAPALAAADLGIALGSGTDLAMQSAPVVLMSNSLERVTEAFDISRATLRVIRQNLFWAFFYNAAGIALAIAGVLTPILAAMAMVLSSLSVIGNSMRLGRSAQKPQPHGQELLAEKRVDDGRGSQERSEG